MFYFICKINILTWNVLKLLKALYDGLLPYIIRPGSIPFVNGFDLFVIHIWPNALLSLNFFFLSYNQQRKYFLLFKLFRFEFLKPNTYCSFQTTSMVIKIENNNVKCKLTWNSCVIRVLLTWLNASLNKIYTIKCDKLK